MFEVQSLDRSFGYCYQAALQQSIEHIEYPHEACRLGTRAGQCFGGPCQTHNVYMFSGASGCRQSKYKMTLYKVPSGKILGEDHGVATHTPYAH